MMHCSSACSPAVTRALQLRRVFALLERVLPALRCWTISLCGLPKLELRRRTPFADINRLGDLLLGGWLQEASQESSDRMSL